MHPALQISDLLFVFFELLDAKNQFRFGLTCKSIWVLARPVLWRNANTRMVRRILSDVRQEPQSDGQVTALSPGKRDTLWSLGYGPYIRHLDLEESETSGPLLEDIFRNLIAYPVEDPALPHLISMSLRLVFKGSVTLCVPFLRSLQLSKLAILISYIDPSRVEPAAKWSVIEELLLSIDFGAHLRSLELDFRGFATLTRQVDDTVSSLLTRHRFPRLREFKISTVTGPVLIVPALAKLPLLENVDIHFYGVPAYMGIQLLPVDPFPTLKSLALNSINNSTFPDFMGSFCSPDLRKLQFTCYLAFAYDTLKVVSDKWAHSLTNLDVIFQQTQEQDRIKFPSNVLHCVAACRNLERVRLATRKSFQLSDEAFDIMSVAWPRLRIFRNELDNAEHSEVTRRAFTLFATRCPDLRYLALSGNLDLSGSPVEPLGKPSWSSEVAMVNARFSSCSDARGAVEFLRSTFPRMKAFASFERSCMYAVEGLLALPAQHESFPWR